MKAISPMEAMPAGELPQGDEWWYEPKWDGFRCIAARSGKNVELYSKAGKTLTRYFPELVAGLKEIANDEFVLDGEIVIVGEDQRLSFDALLQRIHPAASRIKKLSEQTPAGYVVFDYLGGAEPCDDLPLAIRREKLDDFAHAHFDESNSAPLWLSPVARTMEEAHAWLTKLGNSLDGIVAKVVDSPYLPGKRDGFRKIKFKRTADCVIGGFRRSKSKGKIGSLLLGLFDENGVLNHVGHTTVTHLPENGTLAKRLEKLIAPSSFTGRAPGGPSRWSTEASAEWVPVEPELVIEVEFDHFTEGRFRHGTKFLRWRPDKAPHQCSEEQVAREGNVRTLLVRPGDPAKSRAPKRTKEVTPSRTSESKKTARARSAKKGESDVPMPSRAKRSNAEREIPKKANAKKGRNNAAA